MFLNISPCALHLVGSSNIQNKSISMASYLLWILQVLFDVAKILILYFLYIPYKVFYP